MRIYVLIAHIGEGWTALVFENGAVQEKKELSARTLRVARENVTAVMKAAGWERVPGADGIWDTRGEFDPAGIGRWYEKEGGTLPVLSPDR